MKRSVTLCIAVVVVLVIMLYAQTLQVPTGGLLFPNVTTQTTQNGTFLCASGTINNCRFVDASGGKHDFNSTATLTGWQEMYSGNQNTPVSTTANNISGSSFYLPTTVTFSHVWFVSSSTPDANPETGGAIIYLTGANAGTPVCHTSVGVAVPGLSQVVGLPCAEGTVTLPPGLYGKLWTSHSTSASIYMSVVSSEVAVWNSANVIGCTAQSGVINFSTPCNIVLGPSATAGNNPNMLLY